MFLRKHQPETIILNLITTVREHEWIDNGIPRHGTA
jgi:hypothetical protein